MTQQTVKYEGSFSNDTRTIINANFSELYAGIIVPTVKTGAYTLTTADSGSIIGLSAAAGQAITLPAASGSGSIYRFVVITTITSNTTTIKVANASDVMAGVATMGSAGGTSLSTGTTSTGAVSSQSDTITFNGTTQGGIIGTYVDVLDAAANLFVVEVHGVASGIAVTPFSATV